MSEQDRAEAVAKLVYEQWVDHPEYKPWHEGGNSDKQHEARRLAWAIFNVPKPDIVQTIEVVLHCDELIRWNNSNSPNVEFTFTADGVLKDARVLK